jgi:topoisomerase-4 subunit A
MGWIRAGKGHDLDPGGLTYKSGDGFLQAAQLRSNQQIALIDSTGRSYSLPAHNLPSARSHGEPLTGKLSPPAGASFLHLIGGDVNDWALIASDAGYGFLTQLKELHSKNKAGKALLSLPKGAQPLRPLPVSQPDSNLLVAITTEGRMLIFPINELPRLARGKGVKLIGIPSARAAAREELICALTILPEDAQLKIFCGKRHMQLKSEDLAAYRGERGRRGNKLPRGLQRVDGLEVI